MENSLVFVEPIFNKLLVISESPRFGFSSKKPECFYLKNIFISDLVWVIWVTYSNEKQKFFQNLKIMQKNVSNCQFASQKLNPYTLYN